MFTIYNSYIIACNYKRTGFSKNFGSMYKKISRIFYNPKANRIVNNSLEKT